VSTERIPQAEIDDVLARVDIVDVVSSRIELKKEGREYRARCPFHTENTPSFFVIPQKQFYHCFGCGEHGDAIGFVVKHDRIGFLDAFRTLAGLPLKTPSVGKQRGRDSEGGSKVVSRCEWSAHAESLWRQTSPIAGTLGATYLQIRGCAIPPTDSDLRFLDAINGEPPRLCGRITDALTGKPLSLHFTYLAVDGRAKAGRVKHGQVVDKEYLAGHQTRGGCIRLWPDESVTHGLALGEGIESTLAAAHVFTPAWAAMDAGHMEAFPVLDGVAALTLYADHDKSGRGLKAARACGERWRAAGRDVRVFMPRDQGSDCADLAVA
jgi:putative DNA primase/helicase